MLCMPLGHPRNRAQVYPLFSSARSFAAVTKSVETLNLAGEVEEVMRRAFGLLRMGRPGPVMVEIPADVALEEIPQTSLSYVPVKATRSEGNQKDIADAAEVLLGSGRAIIHAGQGVLYADACDELLELAELLQIPVMTTLEGKSAFPENHELALGSASGVMSGPALEFLTRAETVFAVGTSLTKHGMVANLPPGKTIIHATNDERDLNKNYQTQHPILGDAKLVLRRLPGPDGPRDTGGRCSRRNRSDTRAMAAGLAAKVDVGRGAAQSLPRNVGLHQHGGLTRGDRDA